MNTWNILPNVNTNQLDRAAFILDTLSEEWSRALLDFLQAVQSATLLDLVVHTGREPAVLESQLEQLCETRIISLRTSVLGNHYLLNGQRYVRMKNLIRKLATFWNDSLTGSHDF